ncbi:MAG: hypothetical protein LBT43_21035 [Prevotella sp.]|jgi:hypothetical protein|nr:hypothetical protein [Prevotella sp.]MDR2001414.1 hypothetical protein [Prevotella sp.]
MNKLFLPVLLLFMHPACFSQTINNDRLGQRPETLASLAGQFVSPPDAYRPHTWWHWMGSNFNKDGIARDLKAMKESGIGGAVIFNAPSWLNPEQNPWPWQTYRSQAYWDALRYALAEAKNLNMTLGLHNSPGWSTTGGPWIKPEQGMQTVAFSTVKVSGSRNIQTKLSKPREGDITADYFKDVAVMAVPVRANISADDILDISEYFANGILNWQIPVGEWTIYRFGYCPTMQLTHPTPEDVAEISYEADKMSKETTIMHWNNVLEPLKERFGEYIGNTFKYIWTDSYEAWGQSWSPNFRADFIRIKGYDPVTQIILSYERGDSILNEQTHGIEEVKEEFSSESKLFLKDYAEVINRLYLNCWQLGKEIINEAGFLFCFEPYGSIVDAPFDMNEGIGIADMPVTEFWVHSQAPSGEDVFAEVAAKYNKRIIGAEAFTGMEAICTFNETPGMLKRPADMGYSYGINQYFLHTWAHNPFSDTYQPGWSFAHYGTHFGRNQTWFEPGKAFFTYLARCQMLLQQGSFVSRTGNVLHRSMPEAEIFFIHNPEEAMTNSFEFPVTGRTPELWDAYAGIIKSTEKWMQAGNKSIITLKLEKDESVFVIFPAQKTHYRKQPGVDITGERTEGVNGRWLVTFIPKTNERPFKKEYRELTDWSKQNDNKVKYFSGTAVYEKKIKIDTADIKPDKRIILDLGKLYDIAELEINGKKSGTLWIPPYKAGISSFLKAGENILKVYITNTWVNCLIGDEQYPEDFEWTDKNQGLRAMTGLPEWFIKEKTRPIKERKSFVPWYFFNKESSLASAGLLGPVTIIYQDVCFGQP